MNKSNAKKSKQLGINYGTACHQLRQSILFSFIKKLKLHICYRCGKLLTVKTFSIEHKKAWSITKAPKQNFFNLRNISFSHLKCNIGAGSKPNRILNKKGKAWCWDCKTFYKHKSKRMHCGKIRICAPCGAKKKASWRKTTGKH